MGSFHERVRRPRVRQHYFAVRGCAVCFLYPVSAKAGAQKNHWMPPPRLKLSGAGFAGMTNNQRFPRAPNR